MSYRIGTVSALTGINQSTLRAWERRYGIVDPNRSEGGYRVYSREEVVRLTRVRELVDRGLKISEAVKAVMGTEHPLSPGDHPGEVAELCEALRASLLEVDRVESRKHLDRVAALPAPQQLNEVILPILRDIGRLWAAGEITIGEEHFGSTALRDHMVRLLANLGAGTHGRAEVICASAPGERHETGLLALSINLVLDGWKLVYLGADLPTGDLLSMVEQRKPAAALVSVVNPMEMDLCRTLGEELRAGADAGTAVVVGGSGVPESLLGSPVRGLHFARQYEDLRRIPPFTSPNGKSRATA
jgi:MerR family transcriptional regulator, light-induced transcriptional regulator